ncbi:hypothetical protein CcaverHIS002_0301470 [Cutaneotrichosporon cavernicola]|nr:hypothetical protein CcaverHIS002_0301470 [Cutaneotrichosporon cavernicola]
MDDDPNLFVWRSYLPAELCDSQSGPTPQSQFPAYLPPPAFQVSNTLASTGTQYPTHGLLASPAGGQTGLPSQRTPKNATTNRVPKSSLKQNGASSRSRPPSRSGNYLEEIAKARSLRKAKSQTFHRSGGQDRIRNDLINFAKSLSLEQYDRMGFGHDFHTAFWNAFIQQNVYAAPLQESQHILHTHKTALEKASLRFAGGYQISKQKDEKMRTAFEKFLNTYPWGDRVVRKSDVQVAFEKSPEGLPFQVLLKRTPTGGISPYWTHFFKRFAYRWVDAHPRLLHTDTLENVEKTPRRRRLSLPPVEHLNLGTTTAKHVQTTITGQSIVTKDGTSEQIAAQLEALCGLAPPQQTHPLPVSGSFTDYPLPRPEQEATTSHTLYHQAVPVPLPQGNHAVYDNSQIASFHNPDVSFTHLPASGSLPKEFGSSLVTQQSNTNIGPLVFHNGYWCQVGQPVYVHAPIEQPRPVIQNFIDPTKLHVGFRPAQHHEEEGSGSGSSSEDYRSFF